MNPLVVLFGFYLISIVVGKLTVRPGLKTIVLVALLTITEISLVLLFLFNMKPPNIQ